jgi:hypothetical protein
MAGEPIDGGPAFPSHEAGSGDARNQISGGGMSLRAWFAGQALPAMISDMSRAQATKRFSAQEVVDMSVYGSIAMADALIAALKVES